jgi:hypothetical protein
LFFPIREIQGLTASSQGHDSSSAASFEKLLSGLSSKINKESARHDGLCQRQRRYKVLWTLYTTFAYLLAATILILVTGLPNCSLAEYSGLAASPVVIYAVRRLLDAYFNRRLASSQASLNHLNKQRDEAIAKLKEATKYNSTQQLLDKYASAPTNSPLVQKANPQDSTPAGKPATNSIKRTGIPPPPTANIPSRQFPPSFNPATTPPPQQQQPALQPNPAPSQKQQQSPDPQAEFAPNAFSAPEPRHPSSLSTTPRWYDRILDIVLGDDETLPNNRIVLLCRNCRLVNGQAPPGTRSLEHVGTWRCSNCHTLNGQETEAKAMIREIAAGASGEEETREVVQTEKVVDKSHVDDDEDDEKDEEEKDQVLLSSPESAVAQKTKMRLRNRKN